jgi:hypothetical protein
MSLKARLLGLAAGLLFFAAAARADITTGSWYLDHSNEFGQVTNYGLVTILADSTLGTVNFTVDAFDVQPLYGTLNNFGFQSFGFNFDNVTSKPSKWKVELPKGWSQSSSSSGLGGFGSFGKFEVAEVGKGNSRKDPLIFTITLQTEKQQAIASNFAVPNEAGWFFSGHVAGFAAGPGSHKIGGKGSTPTPTPVPAPGAVLLGMIGLGLTSRLRRFA